jgi:hypothetical protein
MRDGANSRPGPTGKNDSRDTPTCRRSTTRSPTYPNANGSRWSYSAIRDALPGTDLNFTTANTLELVTVRSPGVTTLSGIGIGTPLSTLVATVPNMTRVDDDTPAPRYIVFSPDHRRSITFQSDDGVTVGLIAAGVGDLSAPRDYC